MRSERKNKKWGGRKDTNDEMKMLGDGDAKGGGEGGWGRGGEGGWGREESKKRSCPPLKIYHICIRTNSQGIQQK